MPEKKYDKCARTREGERVHYEKGLQTSTPAARIGNFEIPSVEVKME